MRSLVGILTKLGGIAVLITAVIARLRASDLETGETRPLSPEKTSSASPELVTYGVGYVLALALTIAAFALIHWHWASSSTTLEIVFGLALAQIVVHFRCFLHVTLQRSSRDDLQLILFSTLIILLMVGGTLVVIFNLRMRMM